MAATKAPESKPSENGFDYREPPPEPLGDEAADPSDIAASEFDTRDSIVDAIAHGERLDKALVRLAPEFSRNHLQSLIEGGHVRVDGSPATVSSRRLRAGQRLWLELVPTAESRAYRPQPLPLDIVYEDMHLMVLNKPAGLVVHPAPGNWSGTLLNGLLAHHAAAAGLPRAGIVHRLDKDTSGLMVAGKTLEAVTALTRAIAAREVQRHYLALVHGELGWAAKQVDAPIGRDPASRLRMAVVNSGKPARTDVQRVASNGDFSAVECKLHTGRTHQIRVHMAWLGHPLVADALYGGDAALGLTRQALHAAQLNFTHPHDHRWLSFDCPPPDDFAAAWKKVTQK